MLAAICWTFTRNVFNDCCTMIACVVGVFTMTFEKWCGVLMLLRVVFRKKLLFLLRGSERKVRKLCLKLMGVDCDFAFAFCEKMKVWGRGVQNTLGIPRMKFICSSCVFIADS